MQETQRLFIEEQCQFNRYRNAKVALRNYIIKVVDDDYIQLHKHKLTRYIKVDPLTLLTHLWDTYDEVAEGNMHENMTRMKSQWNPPFPIKSLFKLLEEGQAFAKEANVDISEYFLVNLGYSNILATGQFTKYCAKWRNRAIADNK